MEKPLELGEIVFSPDHGDSCDEIKRGSDQRILTVVRSYDIGSNIKGHAGEILVDLRSLMPGPHS